MNPVDELVDPGYTVINLPVKNGNSLTEVVLRVVVEEVSLSNGIISTSKVIEAKLLAKPLSLLEESIAALVNEADSLSCLDNDKVYLTGNSRQVDACLPVGNVDALQRHFYSSTFCQ